MCAFTISTTRKHHRWQLCARILAQSGRFSAPRRTKHVCGVRDSSPARWLPSRGQRLPLRACGGTAMRPHATLRPRLTSNTSRTSHPLSLTVPFTHPRNYWHNPLRISNHWRRRRGEKATAEAEESTVFAAVGGARRNGAASPERLRIEGNARSNSHNPFLHFFPFPPCSIARSRFVEIQAIWRCVGVPAGGGVLC